MKYLHGRPDTSAENTGYEALAAAIIESAAKEYIQAKRWLMEHPPKEYKGDTWKVRREEYKRIAEKALKFFRSEWFSTLVDLDAEKLIEKMDEVIEGERKEIFGDDPQGQGDDTGTQG